MPPKKGTPKPATSVPRSESPDDLDNPLPEDQPIDDPPPINPMTPSTLTTHTSSNNRPLPA